MNAKKLLRETRTVVLAVVAVLVVVFVLFVNSTKRDGKDSNQNSYLEMKRNQLMNGAGKTAETSPTPVSSGDVLGASDFNAPGSTEPNPSDPAFTTSVPTFYPTLTPTRAANAATPTVRVTVTKIPTPTKSSTVTTPTPNKPSTPTPTPTPTSIVLTPTPLPNAAPNVSIVSPLHNANFQVPEEDQDHTYHGQNDIGFWPVLFNAVAIDPEDGTINDTSRFKWIREDGNCYTAYNCSDVRYDNNFIMNMPTQPCSYTTQYNTFQTHKYRLEVLDNDGVKGIAEVSFKISRACPGPNS